MALTKQPDAQAGSPPQLVAAVKDIVQWVLGLRRGPQPLTIYTVTTLPDPTAWNNHTIALSNGTANKPTATAINGVWRYQDGNAV